MHACFKAHQPHNNEVPFLVLWLKLTFQVSANAVGLAIGPPCGDVKSLFWLPSKSPHRPNTWEIRQKWAARDKTNKVSVCPAKTQIGLGMCPAKTQIGLGIRPVWSESSLSAWRKLEPLATHWAHSEDSDQTAPMPRLIWVFAGCTATLLVLSWGSSNVILLHTETKNNNKNCQKIETECDFQPAITWWPISMPKKKKYHFWKALQHYFFRPTQPFLENLRFFFLHIFLWYLKWF